MPLVRRHAARNTPVRVTYAATHPGSRTRTVTRDYLDSYLSTIMTVSTLLVGIGTAEYGLVMWSSVEDVEQFDGSRTLSATTWYYWAVLCIWCGLIPAAWAFGWSLFLTVELNDDEIHPDDYDSAKLWRDFWSPVFSTFPPLLGAAYTFIFFGFVGVMSLKVKPTLFAVTTIQAVYGAIPVFLFYSGFVVFLWHRHKLKAQLHDEREAASTRFAALKTAAADESPEQAAAAAVGVDDHQVLATRLPLGSVPM